MLPDPGYDADRSPYMSTWGVKPRGDDVRPFGCLAIVTKNSAVSGTKLNPRGERGIYVGTCDQEYGGDDEEIGKSLCFEIVVGRRNKSIFSANVVCFPGRFPGVPDTLATQSIRTKGPQADQSEPVGIGNRKPSRSGAGQSDRAADVPKADATTKANNPKARG